MDRETLKREANPSTASSAGVRTVWAMVALCGLILTPIFGLLGLAVMGVGIIGILIG